MSKYGVTPTGFVPKRLDVILDELHTDLSEGFGINTRLNPNSYLNVLLTNFADKIAELWEVAQDNYGSMYPFSAEDISLDNAAQFGGVTREEARPTYYPIHVECVDGTTIPKNARIKSSTNPSIEFITESDTLVTRSAFNRAVLRVVVRNNEVYSIAVDGQVFSYTSSPNASTLEILQGLNAAILSDVFERPPHSIEIIAEGGDDVQIAKIIDAYKSGGIQTYGAIETVIPGDSGEPITIRFNRPTNVYVCYRVTMTLNGSEVLPVNYVALIRDAVIRYTTNTEIGSPIVPKRIATEIYKVVAGDFYTAEVEAFASVDISAHPGGYSAAVIPLSVRERAVTDAARIEVVLSG